MRFWIWLRCLLAVHPITVSVIESFGGQLYAVAETCHCGRRSGPVFPGAFFKAHAETYRDYPVEWQDLF